MSSELCTRKRGKCNEYLTTHADRMGYRGLSQPLPSGNPYPNIPKNDQVPDFCARLFRSDL